MNHRAGLKLVSAAMAALMLLNNGLPLAAKAAEIDVYRQVAELLDAVQPQMEDVTVEYAETQDATDPAQSTAQPAREPVQEQPPVNEAATGQGTTQESPAPASSATPAPAESPAPTPEPTPAVTPEPTATPVPSPEATPVPAASAEPTPAASPVPSASPTPVETPGPNATTAAGESDEVATSENAQTPDVPGLYEDGVILLSSYAQLQQLASDAPLTYADGNAVLDADGAPVTYAADGQYTIVQNIELPEGGWLPPEGFTGRIAPRETAADRPLYDAASDTIYIYHTLQLAVLAQPNAGEEPVMNNDADPALFGVGQMIWPDGEEQPYLTYGAEHRYVLSTQFTTDLPEEMPGVSTMAVSTGTYDGRDFPGQVIKKIDGVEYILIGNEEQLRAIGRRDGAGNYKEVYTAVYNVLGDTLRYSGDADLLPQQNGTDTAYNFDDRPTIGYGVNQETGEIYGAARPGSFKTGKYYSPNENYIIFRNIELTENWDPMMFSGTMIGAVSSSPDKGKLWDSNGIAADAARATISNVTVAESGAIDVSEQMGIGFFGTISSPVSTWGDFLGAEKPAVVKNLVLNGVTVSTDADVYAHYDPTVVGTLVGIVSGLLSALGLLLDIILGWLLDSLGIPDLNTLLGNLLNVRKNDPTAFATGAFAGRIVGWVEVDNCEVINAKVTSEKSRVGGFVGYTAGETTYATKGIGHLLEALQTILNVIPGLGLGDLITAVNNLLDAGKLIPYRYDAPVITGCVLNGLADRTDAGEQALLTIGYLQNGQSKGTEFVGGFVGQQIGTRIENCKVINSNYTVRAEQYGGGFVGLARDAEIEGALSSLGVEGVDLVRVGQPESLLLNCSIELPADDLSVSGRDYIGGFAGALANSYTVNCTINMQQTDKDGQTSARALSVHGNGDSIGGWAGIGTVGWVSSLGGTGNGLENADENLLATVGRVLTELLGSDNGDALLSLIGVAPSAIMGCQINGSSGVTVNAGGKYAGGFVGSGDGLYLASSAPGNLQNLSFWRGLNEEKNELPVPDDSGLFNSITNLTSISANEYAGGIAGSLRTASIAGLLNNVAGVGSYLPFTVQGTRVSGGQAGYTVRATANYAGGGFGELLGGSVGCAYTGDEENKTPVEDSGVYLTNLSSVTAHNVAGGFAAVAGPGELAGASGLELDILGLKLLNVKNLLSLAEGVEVTLTDCTVTGIEGGYTVTATGQRSDDSDITEFLASGFLARSNSITATDCHAFNLKNVTAAKTGGYAGGFLATSRVGGLAQAGEDGSFTDPDKDVISGLIEANGLLSAINYLIPTYTNCTVTYADPPVAEQEGTASAAPAANVSADVAGGFAADFQSGTVDNSTRKGDFYAVYNVTQVTGRTYAGGFAGKLYSGALADAGGGISILGGSGLEIDLRDLLQVVKAYVPVVTHAGVNASDLGLAVSATDIKGENGDLNAGSAGGFAGYASGAQVSTSDVNFLRHTRVTDPAGNADTDAQALNTDGDSYYVDAKPAYAVTGGRYAGGYIGKIDIGSAASVGRGLDVLGETVSLSDLLSALNVVVTTVEHSDVYGAAGGYAVRAAAKDGNDLIGHAGGFAGTITGGHIQDSHAHNFSHIIGRESAGGYVGEMKPGDVAKLLPEGNVLKQLLNVDNVLSGLQVFVPTIRNSSTDSVPCGGVVWAQAESTGAVTAGSGQTPGVQRGMAGGYVGHNEGGQILGLNTDPWLTATDAYTGPTSLCKAVRIRTVFGSEYAGGYTGFMESADMADAGTVSLLRGLITANNILSALKAVYPMQENTAVYGPLADLDVDTWNKWVEFVGAGGGYGFELAQAGKVDSQVNLNAKLANYIYGYDVVAGRSAQGVNLPNAGGDAGGYVGLMRSGVLTNCMAYDVKSVQARGAAGGFAGRAEAGGAASLGGVSILRLELDLGQLVNVAELFVPVIKNSSVQGYRSGMTVTATGTPSSGDDVGYAGGYVGAAYGAQIQKTDTVANITPEKDLPTDADKAKWAVYPDKTAADSGYADPDAATYPIPAASCDVRNLRRVAGRSSVGGYVGLATAASLASVNTNAGSGLLQGILDSVIESVDDLLDLLPATVTTIYKGSVSPADPDWGFVVDGAYGGDQYADYAGGFAGELQAASLGYDANSGVGQEAPGKLTVTGLRQVDGGLYAGGFVGLADVNAVAQVGAGDTSILGSLLGGLKPGSIDAADFIRTYIYHASVDGVDEGYRVEAHDDSREEGALSETRYAGCAGGFAGAVLNGTVGSSTAANVATVQAPNYTGGFVGHMGKSGFADVDDISALENLGVLNGLTAGVIDLLGSQMLDCSVSGYANGLEVVADGGQQPVAGGFAGYADLGRIGSDDDTKPDCTVSGLKTVASDQVAGGFVGQTDMAYLISVSGNSWLVNMLLGIVGNILELLMIDSDRLEDVGLVDINLGIIEVEVLEGGNLLKLELLGLPVEISLNKNDLKPNSTAAVHISIGDSAIDLNYAVDADGNLTVASDLSNITINLIKANRTEVYNSTVTGIDQGYDVFAGGASDTANGDANLKEKGSAGGFVGYNHEGKIKNCQMLLCDVVRGTAQYVGPFTGYNDLTSVYNFNDLKSIEGEGNRYSIYRANDPSLAKIVTSGSKQVGDIAVQYTAAGVTYDRYDIEHIVDFEGIVDTGEDLTIYAMFAALDGAVMTNDAAATSEAPALAAYQESGAKAVLMLDTPNDPNPETTVPKPGVMGDPCAERVDLTVQKIWDDWFDFDGSVTLTIYQQQYTLQNKKDAETPNYPAQGKDDMVWAPNGVKTPYTGYGIENGIVTLTNDNRESAWSDVWSKVLRDAPVFAFEDADSDNVWDEGEIITAYYVYTVEEQDVPDGYEAIIDNYDPTDAGDYELTVTNKRTVELPNTGAAGDAMFVAVGVGLLLLGLARIRRRPRKGER